MDGMADYMRTPSRMFPDMADLEASGFLMSSEKARSLGFSGGGHHPPHHHLPFGSYPRLPALPLATLQQHLLSSMQQQQRNSSHPLPSGSSSAFPPLPFPAHHLLSQWTSLAAGFGLNQLGLFGLSAGPSSAAPHLHPGTAGSPTSGIPVGDGNSSLKAGSSPSHRFSPYPLANPVNNNKNSSMDEDSGSNPAASPALQQA